MKKDSVMSIVDKAAATAAEAEEPLEQAICVLDYIDRCLFLTILFHFRKSENPIHPLNLVRCSLTREM